MLDSFLNVLYVHETRAQQEREAIALLKQLPEGDLMKLASGAKVASLMGSCGPGSDGSFLDKFQGSPLFEEAVALEEQELQADMTSLEKRKEQRLQSQSESGLWDLHDELRIKKRLLELRLAQEDAGGALGAGDAEGAAGLADPLAATPVGTPPILAGGPPAPGAVGLEVGQAKEAGPRLKGFVRGAEEVWDAGERHGKRIFRKGTTPEQRFESIGHHFGKKNAPFAVGAGVGVLSGRASMRREKEKKKEASLLEAVPTVGKTAGIADKAKLVASRLKDRASNRARDAGRYVKEELEIHPKRTGAALGALGMGTIAGTSGALVGPNEGSPKDSFAYKHPIIGSAAQGALAGGVVGGLVGKSRESLTQLRKGGLAGVQRRVEGMRALRQKGRDVADKLGSAEMAPEVDGWGRELAREDFAKAAEAVALEGAATEAGQVLAKHALSASGLGAMASQFAKNPKNLGTLVGGGIGAAGGLASGLQKDEHGQRHILGGLAQGAAGGAAGALAGHATQNIRSAVRGGASVGDAAKQYGKGLLKSTGLSSLGGGSGTAAPMNRGTVLPLRRPSDPPALGLGGPDVSQFAKRPGLTG